MSPQRKPATMWDRDPPCSLVPHNRPSLQRTVKCACSCNPHCCGAAHSHVHRTITLNIYTAAEHADTAPMLDILG